VGIAVTPGQPTVVSTQLAGTTITLAVPAETPAIARIYITAPSAPPPITPASDNYAQIVAVEIDAVDETGSPVLTLTSPMTISITFVPIPSTDSNLVVIYTVDSTGTVSLLNTTTLPNSDGTYTTMAQFDHLSAFVVFAPPGPFVPVAFLPVVSNSAPGLLAGW